MSSRLGGMQVLITRPADQAEKLCQLIEQAGGHALRFPTLAIEAAAVDSNKLQQTLQSDWLIFTSTNAVDFAVKAFSGKMAGLQGLNIAAVGQSTAKALSEAGLNVECVPELVFSSEGLLAEPVMQQVAGLTFTIVRGVGGREKIAQTLLERGAQRVDYLEVYRRSRPEIDNSQLLDKLRRGRLNAVSITSGEALQNLLLMIDAVSASSLKKLPLIVVSDRIKELAQQLGFEQVLVSLQPTDAAILQTLTTLSNGENSGRSN